MWSLISTGRTSRLRRLLSSAVLQINPLDARIVLVVIAQTPEGNASQDIEDLQIMFDQERRRKVDLSHLGVLTPVYFVKSVVVTGTKS